MATDNEDVQINEIASASAITSASKILGINDSGDTVLFGAISLRGDSLGPATTSIVPSSPLINQFYELVGPGTYTNLLTAPGVSLVIPSPTTGNVIMQPRAYYNGTYWVASYQQVAIPSTDTSSLASKTDLNAVQQQISATTAYSYTAPLSFRLYTAQSTFLTSSASISQTDGGASATFAWTGSVNSQVAYFQTGHTITETTGYLKTIMTFNSVISGSSLCAGIGCIRSAGTAFGYIYRGSDGQVLKADDFNTTTLTTLATYTIGDSIEMHINWGTTQTLSIYKNGTLLSTITLPENLTGELCHARRGTFSFTATKFSTLVDKLASKTAVDANTASISAIQNTVNPNYPFLKTATFVATGPVDISWLKSFFLKVQFSGFQPNDTISCYLVQRNFLVSSVPTWTIDIYKDTGSGDGTSKTRVMHWTTTVLPEGLGYQNIDYTEGSYRMQAWVYWPALTSGTQQGSMTYNAAGFDKGTLVNFSSANAVVTTVNGVSRAQWQFNNTNFATVDIAKYTVVKNVDGSGNTLGVTGLGYNKHTKQYVMAEYGFAISSRILLYDRKALTAYSSSGTITPVPTKIIDVTALIDHIEGLDYDPDFRAYWMIGTIKGQTSADGNRVLILVDSNANVLDYYLTPALSYQPGMLVVYGNYLYIKPNNKYPFFIIDKRTKAVSTSVNTFTQFEGLAINKFNGNIWLGDDSGVINQYSGADLSTILATFTNDIPGNQVEGMLSDPADDTIAIVGDSYLHGGNNNGNMLAKYDPLHTYLKFFRFPEMANWQQGVMSSGLRVENDILIGAGTWESPIMDFAAYTDFLTNLAAITQTGKTVAVTYRGSATVPSTTVHTEMPINYYQGWGTTTPSAYISSVVNQRYQQIKLTIS